MEDIYGTTIVCDKCKKPTTKSYVMKNGFKVRTWYCNSCRKQWYHPGDMAAYNNFRELKQRDFQVKLRQVGNSWAVSIPKEIIRFEDITQTKVVKMAMDQPGKLTLFFRKVKYSRG
ncbi:MAG: hypothetical protein ABIB71_08935 [Candidatus Woesearchaeota archaeon]